MHGQWIGRFRSGVEGMLVVDVDDAGDSFEGRAHLFPDDPSLPISQVAFKTKGRAASQRLTVHPVALRAFGQVIGRAEYESVFRDIPFNWGPLEVKVDWTERELALSWEDEGQLASAQAQRSYADNDSFLAANSDVKTWSDFKEFVVSLDHNRFVFRGQPSRWRLRTAFHRTQRKDLVKFVLQDIPDLHRVLSAQTPHYFNLGSNIENAAFWHLLQHHGYPTPLLDWTRSPFVAAYFAFRRDPMRPSNQSFVRVFMFDRREWLADIDQWIFSSGVRPHFSVLDPVIIGNGRALPQQATSFISTVDDIESYIRHYENQKSKQYLHCFDLPVAEQEKVLRELALMGVSPGSLFPGLDGACQELKARNFGYAV